ncbi:PAS domain S-box protein [Hoeflea sp. WL0058]|uniref:histidine kinase n=1 Tax=Flavimaribacter sediminis TaxID=2865987 RepID=A0AAE2ZMS1_9HYPH|nr:PAS domain S-box protein [Flavimaribacter sediminis]MBW8637452.1 PAS domain S-box protein [Flavimaribacter sediminis]
MPSRQYPFIDIAVHDRIREGFASGDAQVLLAQNLTDLLWVNGAGAHLFGYSNLYDFLEEGLASGSATFRQVQSAARSADRSGPSKPHRFAMRIGSGFRRPMLSAGMERIQLSGGEPAYLLTCSQETASETPEDRAGHMIGGFENTGTHAAVLDAEGRVVASTQSFQRLEMDDATRKRLIEDVARDTDRLVKHPVRTALGYLPAAVARIDDDNELHLMFAVEMSIGNLDPAPEPEVLPDVSEHEGNIDAASETETDTPKTELDQSATAAQTPGADIIAPAPPSDMAEEPVENTIDPPLSETDDEAEPVRDESAESTDEGSEIKHPSEAPSEPDDTPETEAAETVAAAAENFVFNPSGRPVRFLWKIDAERQFTEISPEFADVVGPNAADVIGRKFSDVAQVFNIDPKHEIVELLQRRDTWSGKTVFWPVQGTELRVPVDLAALPTYSREREFDGFRGFGIVRCGDARNDPERIGLALADDARPAATTIPAATPDPQALPDADVSDEDADLSAEPVETTDRDATADRPETEKVIQLEDRRTKPRPGLSNAEKMAFREIAEKLGHAADELPAFGKRSNSDVEEPTEPEPAVSPEEPETPVANADTPFDDSDETTPPPEEELPAFPSPEPASGRELFANELPASGRELFANELDRLDVPTVIHNGSSIYFANDSFKALTGFDGAEEVNATGGLPVILGRVEDDDDLDAGNAAMTLHTLHGQSVEVDAKLRSVNWEGKKALMLTFVPLATDVAQPPEEPTPVLEEEPDLASESDPAEARKVAALEVEVNELRSILETATDGVVLLGQDGTIRSLNRSASALFDYDEDEIRGKPFSYLFAHESQRAVRDYLASLSDHGVASVLNDGREVIGREASGRFLPLFMTIGHLSGSNGHCAVMRDITQWKRAEEELRSAKREAESASLHKSEFLARVSHEIRTPLNAIIGFSDLMAEQRFGPIGSPRYVEYANDIGRSGKHVLEIVNDLLDISKIEAGEQELDFAAISLNQTLLDAVTILQPQANRQRVIIRTSLSSAVPDVVADRRSIKQIAINILSNAVRFTPAGGQAVVSSSYEKDGGVVVRIRDTGVGMSDQQLADAMKPFRQVSESARPRGEGTGLGLPLAKAMTEANRAQFSMDSKPGAGTIVEIRFPPQRVLAE